MANNSRGGCSTLIALLFAVAIVIWAVISLAALIDPFDWLPSSKQIWDCSGECELARRYPGFWWHVAANLLYAGLAVAAGVAFLAAVRDVRPKRVDRFDSEPAAVAYAAAHDRLVARGSALAVLAALPILVAIL
jgi:hypothetical protein